jgi:hypothetical protein
VPQCLVKAWQGIVDKKTATGFYSRGNSAAVQTSVLKTGKEAALYGWKCLGGGGLLLVVAGGYWFIAKDYEG